MHLPVHLTAAIDRIRTPAPETAARAHLDSLTKPIGSLGRLEDLAAQLASLNITHLEKAAFVFAADHGLAQEGVSAYPSEVTRQMVLNFLSDGAAINVLARFHHATLRVVDCGVAGDLPEHPCLIGAPVRRGSRNMLHEPAMTAGELTTALELGLSSAAEATAFNLIAAGEMGIGNTSSATLITAALTGRPLSELTGVGTGLDPAGRARKLVILERVFTLHQPYLSSPEETLRRFGGLEIAAMAAFMVGCAAQGAAILVDGFIATAAAAFALQFAPAIRPYLIAAHRSHEPGHRLLLEHLKLDPLLDLQMRLGEGSGAVLAMPIVESSLALYQQMATFASAKVSGATT
jgi:nicotinate-nucleotide--dimethylbenzimidazole phosphoribosyltransferase